MNSSPKQPFRNSHKKYQEYKVRSKINRHIIVSQEGKISNLQGNISKHLRHNGKQQQNRQLSCKILSHIIHYQNSIGNTPDQVEKGYACNWNQRLIKRIRPTGPGC